MTTARPQAALCLFLAVSLFDPGSFFFPTSLCSGIHAQMGSSTAVAARAKLGRVCQAVPDGAEPGVARQAVSAVICPPGASSLIRRAGPAGRKPWPLPRCSSKCFTFQPRDTRSSTPTVNRYLSPERAGRTVDPAIGRGGPPFITVQYRRNCRCDIPGSPWPRHRQIPVAQTSRNFCILRPVARFIFRFLAGGTNQTTGTLPRPTTRVLTIPRPPTCKWHPADV
jgi:hypothetical protein